MCDSLRPHGLYSSWHSPGQNTGVGSLSLLQGIFPTQGSNPDLLHCRRILHQLSPQGRKENLAKKPPAYQRSVFRAGRVTQLGRPHRRGADGLSAALQVQNTGFPSCVWSWLHQGEPRSTPLDSACLEVTVMYLDSKRLQRRPGA